MSSSAAGSPATVADHGGNPLSKVHHGFRVRPRSSRADGRSSARPTAVSGFGRAPAGPTATPQQGRTRFSGLAALQQGRRPLLSKADRGFQVWPRSSRADGRSSARPAAVFGVRPRSSRAESQSQGRRLPPGRAESVADHLRRMVDHHQEQVRKVAPR